MRLAIICKCGVSACCVSTLRGSLRYDNYFDLRFAARGDGNWLVGAPTRQCQFANPKR
jgi:hypothetical protein